MNLDRFRGAAVALITPFDSAGLLDEPRFRRLLDWQVSEGTEGVVVAGTTGEASTLSMEEQVRLFEVAVDQIAGRVPVIAGTGSNATQEAICLTREAERVGCDATLSVGPYYNKPTQEGFYRHFRAIAESAALPVILYNVPGRTGSNMSAGTTLRLAEIDNIIGIKEASGNLSQIMEILRNRPESFLLLSGDDAIALPMISLGADGVISVVANEVPRLFREMIRSALQEQWAQAREIHYRLLPLMELNFIEANPIPVKTALAMMGRVEEKFRLPLVEMTEANRSKLRSALEGLGLVQPAI